MTEETIKKLSKLERPADVVLLQSIEEVKDEMNERLNAMESEHKSYMQEVCNKIDSIEKPKDHTGHMKVMMDKMEEPLEVIVKLNIT